MSTCICVHMFYSWALACCSFQDDYFHSVLFSDREMQDVANTLVDMKGSNSKSKYIQSFKILYISHWCTFKDTVEPLCNEHADAWKISLYFKNVFV